MGLRGKFPIVLSFSVVAAVCGTTFIQSRLFAGDQRAYVTDFQTTLAVLTEKQLRSRLDWLHGQGEALMARGGVERLASEIPGCLGGEVRKAQESRSSWTLLASPLGREAVRWVGRYGSQELILDLSPSVLDGTMEASHGAFTRIVDAKGHTLLGSGPGSATDTAFDMSVRGAQTKVALGSLVTALVVPAEPPFVVTVATPLSVVESVVGRVYRQSAWLALSFLALSLLVGAWLAANLTSPLLRLTKEMEGVARGELQAPSGEGSQRLDEVGALSRAFVLMIRDLTRMRFELARGARLAAFGKFSAAIAHEIKNPLSSILGNAQVAAREFMSGAPDAAVVAQALGFVKDETLRANRIVTQLMKFAREVPEATVAIDLTERIRQSFAVLRPEIERESVELRLNLPSVPVMVRAGGDPVHEIVANLVANALHALRGSEHKIIWAELKLEGGSCVFSLRDSGCGISDAALGHLFEPFFTTKPLGEGTGLGLSVCHGICERYGGTLSADNHPEGGARFVIRLPLCLPAEFSAAA